MRELLTGAIKKVGVQNFEPLHIYQVVEERTKDLLEVVNDIKKRQENVSLSPIAYSSLHHSPNNRLISAIFG